MKKIKYCSVEGFTLIELMIAVTILGVVTLIVASALHLGARAWEKGTEKDDRIQATQVVFGILKGQIASALPYETIIDGKTSFFFKGDDKQLQYVSMTSLYSGKSYGNVIVTYRVSEMEKKKILEVLEQRIVSADLKDDSTHEEANTWRTLAENLNGFSFEYAGCPEPNDGLSWVEQWDSNEQGGVPAAVKITMDTGADISPFQMVIRLVVENT